ncbi:MAG: AzlD domain-containing protein [Ruminococcus sp.]|nr:AzlD domain-containing protein [Ruminococcus sp.]
MSTRLILYIAVMAGVTYLVRALPMMVFRKKIKSQLVQSFLYYVPYAVLGAMTVPAVFYATGNMISASVGLAAAFVLAFFGQSLIVVALTASGAAFIAELMIGAAG